MKIKSKFFIIVSIIILFSINSIVANIQQNANKINTKDEDSINFFSTPEESAEGDVTSLWNYTFSNSPSRVTISGDGNYIMVINMSTATFFHRNSNRTLWIHDPGDVDGLIRNEAMSFNGKYIVLCDTYRDVILLDSTSKTELWRFDDSSGIGNVYVDISDDGKYIAVANSSGGVYLFDNNPSGGQKQAEWYYDDGTSKIYNDVAISGNGQYVVVGDGFGNITLFTTTITTPKSYEWQYYITGKVWHVAISYEGDLLVAQNNEGEVYLFNTTNPQGKPMWNFTAPNSIKNIDISSDGNNILVGDIDNLYYFNNSFQSDNKTAEWCYPIVEPSVDVSDCAISSIGEDKYVVLGTEPEKTCYLFNGTKTTLKKPLWKNPIEDVTSVDISEYGDYFVFNSYFTNTIYLYHHNIPISRALLPLVDGDDNDDDNEDSVIPYGNYYLLFTGVAIVALILIMNKKILFNQKK